ncbi:MAG: glycoside hydrolase family 32 protein [Chloroflexota bacterium]
MRTRFQGDPHRPAYHFLPPANWMNDPNGLIHWRGRYHMFYQHNPNGAFWGTMHWGHAASSDLVRWEHLPIALAPGPEPYDDAGIYSGIALDDHGVPTIMYTATSGPQSAPSVALAVGDQDLVTWRKDERNPVILPPPDLDLTGFRDHTAWREGPWWYQLIGAGIRGVGGAVLLYRSQDLRSWEYLGPACVGDAAESGTMWECPDLFALGGRHVLVISPIPLERAVYFTGTYAAHRFTPDGGFRELDPGGSLYAPQSFRDARGRRIMFGWLREERAQAAQIAAGWSGAMSLPRVLSLLPDGGLSQAPAPEVETLRQAHARWEGLALPDGRPVAPDGLRGDRLELLAVIDPGEADAVGLAVRAAPVGEERTLLLYERAAGRLVVDRSRASLDPDTARDVRACALALAPGEPLRLRVFVDRSVIETFANERACMASRVYPTRPDALGVELFARGGAARLIALDAWEMEAVTA